MLSNEEHSILISRNSGDEEKDKFIALTPGCRYVQRSDRPVDFPAGWDTESKQEPLIQFGV